MGTKTENRMDSNRYVPLTDSLREVLNARKPVSNDDFVFTQGGNITPKIHRILRQACEAIGLTYGRDIEGGFELYCARHTFTTRLLQSGADLATVGAITGHSDRELVLHYSHITPESTSAAAARIEQIEVKRLPHILQVEPEPTTWDYF